MVKITGCAATRTDTAACQQAKKDVLAAAPAYSSSATRQIFRWGTALNIPQAKTWWCVWYCLIMTWNKKKQNSKSPKQENHIVTIVCYCVYLCFFFNDVYWRPMPIIKANNVISAGWRCSMNAFGPMLPRISRWWIQMPDGTQLPWRWWCMSSPTTSIVPCLFKKLAYSWLSVDDNDHCVFSLWLQHYALVLLVIAGCWKRPKLWQVLWCIWSPVREMNSEKWWIIRRWKVTFWLKKKRFPIPTNH